MRFLVITSAPTLKKENVFVAYEPYVREMNIWTNYVEKFIVLSPTHYKGELLTSSFNKQPIVISLKELRFNSLIKIIFSLIYVPLNIWFIFKACQNADHIHLRCPGNIGLLGCLVQIFFPSKTKTAKYAGNWDPKAKQPLSYRFQKWLLSNTFLTKNMQVLVYGHWQNQTQNIKPFFTASFLENEKEPFMLRDFSGILKFVFIGSLVKGKQPLLAIQIIEALHQQGKRVHLDLYGDGVLKDELCQYVAYNKLENIVTFHGNKSKDIIKAALRVAHFSILPSKSEGWPKSIAEAMFFGVIPIATPVSCVPSMLDDGGRGVLISGDLKAGVEIIIKALNDVEKLKSMSQNALHWSQNYTLEVFENEISKLLH